MNNKKPSKESSNGSNRGRGGFRGGGRGRGTPRTGRGGLQYQAGSMNSMGFDYSQINTNCVLFT